VYINYHVFNHTVEIRIIAEVLTEILPICPFADDEILLTVQPLKKWCSPQRRKERRGYFFVFR